MRSTSFVLICAVSLIAGCVSSDSQQNTVASRSTLSLTDVTWHWVRTLDPERSWAPNDLTRYTLQLDGNGRALVRADCNRGSGSYTSDDKQLQLGPIATTRMMCPTADGLDARYLQQLEGIRIVTLVDGMLRADLFADSGTMFFVSEPDARYASYRCEDGKEVWAVYTKDRARVTVGPDTYDLPDVVSASGAKYEANGVTWFTKADEALLTRNGEAVLKECRPMAR